MNWDSPSKKLIRPDQDASERLALFKRMTRAERNAFQRIVIMRLKTDELLVLAVSGVSTKRALALYKERWGIETLFSCLKKRGLGLESTHMSQPKKISTLIAVLALAFCMAFKTGRWVARHSPPARKNHGYRAVSLFALGLNALRKLFAEQNNCQTLQYISRILSEQNPHNLLMKKDFYA